MENVTAYNAQQLRRIAKTWMAHDPDGNTMWDNIHKNGPLKILVASNGIALVSIDQTGWVCEMETLAIAIDRAKSTEATAPGVDGVEWASWEDYCKFWRDFVPDGVAVSEPFLSHPDAARIVTALRELSYLGWVANGLREVEDDE